MPLITPGDALIFFNVNISVVLNFGFVDRSHEKLEMNLEIGLIGGDCVWRDICQ